MNFNQFLKLCYDKKVVSQLSIFIIASWTIIQVTSVTHDALGLPEEFVSFLILLMFLSFPFYSLLIWKKTVIPSYNEDGETEEKHIEFKQFKRYYFIGFTLTALLCLVCVSVVIKNKFINQKNNLVTQHTNSDKIAVLNFENNTNNEEYDVIGRMASDWISHGLTLENIAKVVTPDVINSYEDVLETSKNQDKKTILSTYLRPKSLITGAIFLERDQLIIKANLIAAQTNDLIASFESDYCSPEDPLICINNIKQRLLTYLATEQNVELRLQKTPPKYDAYKLMLEAKSIGDITSKNYLNLINKAIRVDENYFEPQLARVAYYYDKNEIKVADSLLKVIKPESYDNKRQINLLNYYKNLLLGNNGEIYSTLQTEYNYSPFDIETNTSMMIVALQFVNKPEETLKINKEIDKTILENTTSTLVDYRKYIKSLANIEVGNSIIVINELKEIVKTTSNLDLVEAYTIALIKENDIKKVSTLLNTLDGKIDFSDYNHILQLVINHLIINNKADEAKVYLNEILNKSDINGSHTWANYQFANYKLVISELTKRPVNELSSKELYMLASSYFLSKENEKADEIITYLSTFEQTSLSEINYLLAQFYADTEQQELAMKELQTAVVKGAFFTPTSFQNDSSFSRYQHLKEFKAILNYWKTNSTP